MIKKMIKTQNLKTYESESETIREAWFVSYVVTIVDAFYVISEKERKEKKIIRQYNNNFQNELVWLPTKEKGHMCMELIREFEERMYNEWKDIAGKSASVKVLYFHKLEK